MWKWGKYLVCLLLLVVGVTSCYYRTALPTRVDGEGEEGEEESSVAAARPFGPPSVTLSPIKIFPRR